MENESENESEKVAIATVLVIQQSLTLIQISYIVLTSGSSLTSPVIHAEKLQRALKGGLSGHGHAAPLNDTMNIIKLT